MDDVSLIVSIVAAVIAIASIIQAWRIRTLTRNETEEQLNFLIHLIANSAADPDTVRRMLEDYGRAGEWRAKISRRPNGMYGLDFSISAGGGSVKPKGKLDI